jgi:nucleotide-binding universal stress UspA family protein
MKAREHFDAPTIRSVRRRRAVAERAAGWSILVAEGTVMIALKNILVPTDFSDTSANAVRYAKAFAETFQASLHLLHVVEELLVYAWTPPEGSIPLAADIRADLEVRTREQLHKLLTDAERERFHAHFLALTGSPFVEIVRYAKEQDIDLIIMGTHGRGPIAHMLMGSVAEKVVRKAPCPVLTVRHPEHEFVMP